MKIRIWLTLALLAAFYVLGLALFNRMPDPMATHWNAQGAVDGYISRFWGIFLFPFIVTGVSLLLLAVPRIDPLKANIAKFRVTYDWFVIVFLLYMLYVYLVTLLWNLNVIFNFVQVLVPAMAVLFFFVGVLLGRAKRNYMVGIRTPWTLASDEVWDRTHRLGARLFMGAALLMLVGIIWPDLAIWFIMAPLLSAALVTVLYSYVIYQRIKPGPPLGGS
jgi:uncharacterized membrane protein